VVFELAWTLQSFDRKKMGMKVDVHKYQYSSDRNLAVVLTSLANSTAMPPKRWPELSTFDATATGNLISSWVDAGLSDIGIKKTAIRTFFMAIIAL
jgi:hypothetical protein